MELASDRLAKWLSNVIYPGLLMAAARRSAETQQNRSYFRFINI